MSIEWNQSRYYVCVCAHVCVYSYTCGDQRSMWSVFLNCCSLLPILKQGLIESGTHQST